MELIEHYPSSLDELANLKLTTYNGLTPEWSWKKENWYNIRGHRHKGRIRIADHTAESLHLSGRHSRSIPAVAEARQADETATAAITSHCGSGTSSKSARKRASSDMFNRKSVFVCCVCLLLVRCFFPRYIAISMHYFSCICFKSAFWKRLNQGDSLEHKFTKISRGIVVPARCCADSCSSGRLLCMCDFEDSSCSLFVFMLL